MTPTKSTFLAHNKTFKGSKIKFAKQFSIRIVALVYGLQFLNQPNNLKNNWFKIVQSFKTYRMCFIKQFIEYFYSHFNPYGYAEANGTYSSPEDVQLPTYLVC